MIHLIIFVVGMLAGFFIGKYLVPTLGTMYITHTDEKDIYRLDVTCPMETLPKRKYLKLKVSQEKQPS